MKENLLDFDESCDSNESRVTNAKPVPNGLLCGHRSCGQSRSLGSTNC